MAVVITDQHLAGALKALNNSMVIAKAYPSPLTSDHMHDCFAMWELLTLQSQLERRENASTFDARQAERQTGIFPISGARLQADDESA